MTTVVAQFAKVVGALPTTLLPSTVYVQRTGLGFDLYVTDKNGAIAFRHNNTDPPLTSPVMAYSGGRLSSIVYADGALKTFTYTGGQLTQLDLVRNGLTTRKVFTYTSGQLSSVTETQF